MSTARKRSRAWLKKQPRAVVVREARLAGIQNPHRYNLPELREALLVRLYGARP